MRITPDYIVVDLKRRKVHGMLPFKGRCNPHFESCGVAIGILFEKISPMIKIIDDESSKVLTAEILENLNGEIINEFSRNEGSTNRTRVR